MKCSVDVLIMWLRFFSFEKRRKKTKKKCFFDPVLFNFVCGYMLEINPMLPSKDIFTCTLRNADVILLRGSDLYVCVCVCLSLDSCPADHTDFFSS